VALPFTAQGEDIRNVREILGEGGHNIKILAKIDSIHGVENYEDILFEADGMIFCRNEL
jgi:pyruvate kinase